MDKYTLRFVMISTTLIMIACGPVSVVTVPVALRPMAIHGCVANATYWLDGSGVPALRDVADANGNITFPRFPATVPAFNIHASSPGLPEFGLVVDATTPVTHDDGSAGLFVPGTDPVIIFLGGCTR